MSALKRKKSTRGRPDHHVFTFWGASIHPLGALSRKSAGEQKSIEQRKRAGIRGKESSSKGRVASSNEIGVGFCHGEKKLYLSGKLKCEGGTAALQTGVDFKTGKGKRTLFLGRGGVRNLLTRKKIYKCDTSPNLEKFLAARKKCIKRKGGKED